MMQRYAMYSGLQSREGEVVHMALSQAKSDGPMLGGGGGKPNAPLYLPFSPLNTPARR
jgi:hypothetical protein